MMGMMMGLVAVYLLAFMSGVGLMYIDPRLGKFYLALVALSYVAYAVVAMVYSAKVMRETPGVRWRPTWEMGVFAGLLVILIGLLSEHVAAIPEGVLWFWGIAIAIYAVVAIFGRLRYGPMAWVWPIVPQFTAWERIA